MNNIKKENLYAKENNYNIYELVTNKENTPILYYMCTPNNKPKSNINIYIGFPNINLTNSSKEDIDNEIKEIADMTSSIDNSSIYLMCNIDYKKIKEAANDNDNIMYNDILNDLSAITHNAYEIINKENDKKINQVITAIKQNENDSKLIDWLELKLNGFIDNIKIKDLRKKYYDIVIMNTSIINLDEINESIKKDNNTTLNNNSKTKKLIPQNDNHGFTSYQSLIILITISLSISIWLAYFLLKLK